MEKKFDNLFAFVLGREQKIARAELKSVLRHFGFCFDILSLSGNIVLINIERGEDFPNNDIMSVLGGTMEIYKIIAMADSLHPDIIYSQISSLLEGCHGRVTFGISDYSKTLTEAKINTLGLDVKKKLKLKFSARFVAERGDSHLSSAAIISNRLHKDGMLLGIFSSDKQYLIGKLIGVTNPNEWSKRDFGKPKSDKFSGMTPPKLARALINITLSQAMTNDQFPISNENSKIDKLNENCELKIGNYNDFVVVDPFCGSGNILIEAAVLGCEIIGSDISEKAVDNTKANLSWLRPQISNLKSQTCNSKLKIDESTIQQFNNTTIFQADATKFDFAKILKAEKNFIIVTEPYLGQPKKFKPTMNAVKGEYQKIKPLCLDFLNNLKAINYKLEAICVIFPLVETMEEKQYSLLDECIDEIRRMGYTLICEPFVYGRDYQVVKREIVLLKLT